MKNIVISYVRVSTKEQLKGHSIEAQTEMLDNYAKYHLTGYEMERYKDKGKTATNMRRAGLKNALARIEAEVVEVLLVKSLDRLVRNTEDAHFIMRTLQLKQTRIVTPYYEYDLDTVRGRKRFKEDAIDAESESENTSERVLDTKHKMAKDLKYPHGGYVPYGYSRDENQILTPIKEEVEIIRDLFYHYAYEGKTAKEVSEYALETYGLERKPNSIYQFLTKPIYKGVIITDDVTYKIMEPILTEEDFEQLHNRKVIKGYSKHGYKYRHKIYINGELSYMTTKKKKNKVHKYYYIPGYKYFNEKEIDKMIRAHHLELYERYNVEFSNKLVIISEEYIRNNMTKDKLIESLDKIRKDIFGDVYELKRVEITVDTEKNYTYEIFT